MKHILLKIKNRFIFLPPVLLWAILVKDFFSKKALVVEDTFAVYAVTKYYLDNIFTGIFPSWNPYVLWGMAHLRQIGEFNPLWFTIPILANLGMDYYSAFMLVFVTYFLIGLWGFYRLIRALAYDAYLSYWAVLLMLFSSISLTMFVQPTFLLIFVPTVWFFYFLIEFAKARRLTSFLFLNFCLFQALTTYIPFYFLIIVVMVFVFLTALYPKDVWRTGEGFVAFVKKYPGYSAFCLAGLALACLSQIFMWLSLQDGFVPLARSAVLTFDDVRESGVPAVEFTRDFSPFGVWLFTAGSKVIRYGRQIFNLSDLSYDNQRFFYVPFIAHLVFYYSIISHSRRKGFVFLACAVVLFLLVIGPITPIYEFLFQHVFFFKMFRNVFLFEVFLIAFYIMLVVEQVHILEDSCRANTLTRYLKSVFLIIVFALLVRYLTTEAPVLPQTQLTVLGSFILFFLYAFPKRKIPRAVFFLGLYFLTIIQPVGVIRTVMASASETRPAIIAKSVEVQSVKPQFSFTRPKWDKDTFKSLDEYDRYRQFCYYFIAQEDSPGFISKSLGYPTEWANLLHHKVNIDDLNSYLTNKIYLYDRIQWMKEEDWDYLQFGKDLKAHKNIAYVSLAPGQEPANLADSQLGDGEIAQQALAISEETEQFQVKSFTVNSLRVKTNFPQAKFFVYNDSYQHRWKVFINKKEANLLRSNLAFKGVWLPAGSNEVVFTYQPLGGNWLGFVMLGYSFGLFVLSIVFLTRKEAGELR